MERVKGVVTRGSDKFQTDLYTARPLEEPFRNWFHIKSHKWCLLCVQSIQTFFESDVYIGRNSCRWLKNLHRALRGNRKPTCNVCTLLVGQYITSKSSSQTLEKQPTDIRIKKNAWSKLEDSRMQLIHVCLKQLPELIRSKVDLVCPNRAQTA